MSESGVKMCFKMQRAMKLGNPGCRSPVAKVRRYGSDLKVDDTSRGLLKVRNI
jgi:hypothetical protein